MGNQKTYTVAEAARILGYSTDRIYEYLRTERILGMRVKRGSKWLIPQDEIKRLTGETAVQQDSKNKNSQVTGQPTQDKKDRFSTVLQHWKKQLQYQSPSQLLGELKLPADLVSQAVENKETLEIYECARKAQYKPLTLDDSIPHIKQYEPLIRTLMEQFPGNAVWELYDSWRDAHFAYCDAAVSWFNDLQEIIKMMILGAVDKKFLEAKNLDNSLFALTQELGDLDLAIESQLLTRWISIIVGCDLLALGFQELQDQHWFFEIVRLNQLRGALILEGKQLLKRYSFDSGNNYSGIAKLLFKDPRDRWEVRAKTMDLLGKLEALRETQSKLLSELTTFEGRLLEATTCVSEARAK